MPSGAHMPVPVGAVNSWGFQNTSTAGGPTGTVGPAGTGVPAPSITMPMGYQPTTLQTVVASSSQAPVQVAGTTDSKGNPGGQVQQGGLSGGLDSLGTSGEEGEEECDWVED